MSGCSESATGQVWAARSSLARAASWMPLGMLKASTRRWTRRGGAAVMCFSTRTVAPSSTTPSRWATMPMMVHMQVPRPVASRSVGEKLSPRP